MKILRFLLLIPLIAAVIGAVSGYVPSPASATELLSSESSPAAPQAPSSDGLILDLPEAPSVLPSQNSAREEKSTQRADERRVGLLMKYYNRCMDIIYTDLPETTQKSYCACTAEQIHKNLSESELIILATGSGPAIDQKKMALEVEALCLQYPATDILYKQCRLTTRTNFFRTQEGFEAYCHCWGKKAFPFFETYGADIAALAFDPANPPDDLLSAIQNTQAYKKEFTNWRKTCLQNYAYN